MTRISQFKIPNNELIIAIHVILERYSLKDYYMDTTGMFPPEKYQLVEIFTSKSPESYEFIAVEGELMCLCSAAVQVQISHISKQSLYVAITDRHQCASYKYRGARWILGPCPASKPETLPQ